MTVSEAESQIQPMLEKMGFKMVELGQYKKAGRTHLQLVIYKAGGVSMDDCVQVHRMLFPRLEMSFEKDDIYLEISSPGLGRKFKDVRECRIFKGQAVALLLQNESEWLKGILKEADDQGVILVSGDEEHSLSYDSIQKGKLDFDKEIR